MTDPLTEAVKAGAAALIDDRFPLGIGLAARAARVVLTAAIEAQHVVIPWTCDDCAFTFDADHTDPDGGSSCPACAEHSLTLLVERLRAELAEERRKWVAVVESKDARLAEAKARTEHEREKRHAIERHISRALTEERALAAERTEQRDQLLATLSILHMTRTIPLGERGWERVEKLINEIQEKPSDG